jgi:TonB family protein
MSVSIIVLVSALTASAPYAEDVGGTQSAPPDLTAMLNSLPEVKAEPAAMDDKAPEDDPLARDAGDAFADYGKAVEASILTHWDPSKKLVKSQPTAVAKLLVSLDGSGAIKSVGLLESSGDDAFNKSALDAIKKTAKVDAPAPEIAGALAKGVVVTFEARSKLVVKADPE